MRLGYVGAVFILVSCSRDEPSTSNVTAGSATPSAASVPETATRRESHSEGLPSSMQSAVGSLDRQHAVAALMETAMRLESAMQLSELDCPTAETLRDRICELAGRICELGGKERGFEDKVCESSRESCRSARQRVAERCE